MVIDTIKENLSINKLITTKKEIIFVEGDVIVPDSKPDILSTICTSGVVCIYKEEILDEKIKLDGNINTYIMYLSENSQDKTRGINTSLDFSENIMISNCKEGMNAIVNTTLKTIECKVINGRKLGIKASLEIDIKVYDKEDIQIVNDIQNANEIQMLKENLKVNSLVGTGDAKIYAKDTISIDSIDNLAEILKTNMSICDKDIKISYQKVLTKAEAQIKLMYLTEDNRINTVNSKIPIVGFVDIPNVSEENMCDVNYEVKNIIIKPNSVEEHSIYVEIEIAVSVIAYEEKSINLIQDLYSPCENLTSNRKLISTITDKRNIHDVKQVREEIALEGLENKNIIDVDINPIITQENKLNSRIIYEGELELKFILANANMEMNTNIAKIPFEYTIENVIDGENRNINTDIQVSNQDFIVSDGGKVKSNIDLAIDSSSYKNTNLNVMDEIQTEGEREEEDYSIIMYIIKKGDTLWNIAKRFGSTVDDIARANGIEDANIINPGQKIYIPRYTKREAKNNKAQAIAYV